MNQHRRKRFFWSIGEVLVNFETLAPNFYGKVLKGQREFKLNFTWYAVALCNRTLIVDNSERREKSWRSRTAPHNVINETETTNCIHRTYFGRPIHESRQPDGCVYIKEANAAGRKKPSPPFLLHNIYFPFARSRTRHSCSSGPSFRFSVSIQLITTRPRKKCFSPLRCVRLSFTTIPNLYIRVI